MGARFGSGYPLVRNSGKVPVPRRIPAMNSNPTITASTSSTAT